MALGCGPHTVSARHCSPIAHRTDVGSDGRHRDADPTGAVALDELDVVDEVAVLGLTAVEAVEQQLRHRLAEAHHRLCDGREVERPGDLVVVEPCDRHVLRHPQAVVPHGPHGPDGHLVGEGEHRGRRLGVVEHAVHRLVAAGDREPARLQVRGDRRQPRLLHGAERAPQPQVGHIEVDRRVRLAADQPDVLVAQLDQVADDEAGRGLVVDADRGELVGPVAQRGDGHPGGHQPGDQVARHGQLGQDQPVRPLPVRRALRQEAVERGLPVDLVQDEVEAPLRQHRLDAGHDLPEVPAVEERDGHADGVRAARGQSGGVGIGLVVEAGGGLGHPGPGVRGDVGEAPQGPAHGGDGDTGDGRHVADGGAVGLRSALSHVASLPSSSAGVTSTPVVPRRSCKRLQASSSSAVASLGERRPAVGSGELGVGRCAHRWSTGPAAPTGPPPLDRIAAAAAARFGPDAELVVERLRRWWPEAEAALRRVYGAAVDDVADRLGTTLLQLAADRSPELRRLDSRREAVPDWFQQPGMVGYVCYADRFAGDLRGVAGHLDYLAELGVTYLHLMPLLRPREGENDGGYAVQSYEEVDPALGTMDDLEALAAALRQRGMSLCVDVV